MKRYYSILSALLTLFLLSNTLFSSNLFAKSAAKSNILIEDWTFENSLKLNNQLPALDYSKKVTANLKPTSNTFAIRVIGADIGTKNPTCNGANDGKAWVNSITIFAGSPGPFTYTWTLLGATVATGDTARNLGGGSYILRVFDANDNTTFSKGFTITNPIDLAANMFPVDESCFGACDGFAFTNATGGTQFSNGTYNYIWSNSATTPSISGLCVGNYSVTITDSTGCTAVDNITVGGPAVIQPNVTTNPVKCKGDNDGVATASPSGGVPTYTYLWSNAATSQSISGLAPGNYTVTVSDNTSCTRTQTVTITEPATLLSANITVVNAISCNGNTDGILTGNGIGGVPPYVSYAWSNSQNTKTIINIPAGTYTVTVTDNNGCTTTASTTLTNPSLVTAAINLPATNVSCNGLSDGSATVVPGGGIGAPYTYLWSDNQTNATATNLAAGTYTVTVFDGNNCEGTDQVTITEPTTLVASIKLPVKNVSCFGGADGEAEAEGTGGTLNYSYLWSNAETSALNTGLTQGTYTVTITDNNGCTASVQTTITQPTQVGVGITKTADILCNGGNQGALLATGNNGTPGYSYLWSNAVNTATNTGLNQGTYTVTVTDSKLCTSTAQFVLNEPTAVSASINIFNNPLCNGQSNGAATVTSGGGTPGYTYLWNTTATTQTIVGLSSGTYTVTVNDANSCSATTQITLIDLSTVTAAISLPATNVSCFGGNDGAATVNPGGGAGGFSYLWSNNQTNATATGLIAGTYTVTVSDANGCTASDQVRITEPTLLTVDIPTSANVTCNGLSNGTATAIPNGGGTGTPTYLWSNAATTASISGLAAGTYTVTISDDNSCTATNQIVISAPSALSIAVSSRINVLCKGNNTGSLTTTFNNGGTPGYTFLWSNGQTAQNATNLIAATYTITVTDANMCTATASRSILEPANALTGIISGTNATCNGFADGSADIIASGGTSTGTYNYIWSNNATTSTITNLLAGTYSVTVTDANGCPFVDQVLIGQNTVISTTTSKTDVNCFGDSTGSATVLAFPANPNYTYLWSNGNTTTNATTLPAGKFYVTVSDPLGCFAIDSVTIIQKDSIQFNITKFDATCNSSTDGIAIVNGITGGTPGYTFQWKTGSLSGPTFSTFSTILNVAANTYYIIVTDVNGCSSSDSVIIAPSNPINLLISDTTHASCNGGADGSAVVVAANGAGGPYTYLWSNSQTADTLKNVTAGTYTVTVTDNSTCTGSISILISEPTAITTVMSADSVSCFGLSDGSATVATNGGTPNPGYSFLWSTTATTATVNGLAASRYFVTVTDGNGCTKKDSVDVEEPIILAASITPSPALCKDSANGSATVTATGGTTNYSYLWSNAGTNQNQTGLLAGNYTVTVTDKNGCTATANAAVGEPATSVTSIIATTNATCSGKADGTATVTPSGGTPSAIAPGYTFLWSNSATTSTINNLLAGDYFVTITDGNGCVRLDTANVLDGISIFVSVDSIKMVDCNGGNNGHIEVSGINGTLPYTYAWTNSASTTGIATNLAANSYTVTITDNNGCFKDTTFIITEPNVLTVSVATNDETCLGKADGDATASSIGGTPGYTYNWSTSQTGTSINNLAVGNYTVTVTDDNGCMGTSNFTINPKPGFTIVDSIMQNRCFGDCNGSIEVVNVLNSSAPLTFTWNPIPPNGQGNNIATNLCAGIYNLNILDNNGCDTNLTYTITEPTLLTSIATSTDATCSGTADGTATVTPSGGTPSVTPPGYTFLWSNTATTQSLTSLTSGQYFVTITDSLGCIKLDTATVLDGISIFVSLDSIRMNKCNAGADGYIEVSGIGGAVPHTYLWSNASTNNQIDNLIAGAYTVTITDNNGCFKDTTINVTESAPIVIAGTVTNVNCNGAADGSIAASASGGIPPFTYLWSNAQTNSTINNLLAGNYTVTVTDDSLCTESRTFTVNPQSGFTFIDSITNNNCFGDCNGSIEIFNLAGGTAPYTFTWNPIPPNGQGSNGAFNLCVGTYNLNIRDLNGCDTNLTYTITEPTLLTSIATSTDATCSGFSDGTATVTPSGGTPSVIAPGYTYLWSNSSTTQSLTGLTSGQYQVTITDSLGCIKRDTATVLDGISIFVSLDSLVNIKCNGNGTGLIRVSVKGGSTPYTYLWSNASTNTLIDNLTAGAYTVTITDNNGCFKDSTINITESAPIIIAGTVNNTSCNGTADGSIAANATGGTPPFTYLWSTSQTTSTINNLSAGAYTVTATDDSLCTQVRTFNVSPQSSFTFIDSVTNNNCFGDCNGSIEIFNLAGGTAPYTFTWSPIPPNGQGNSFATGLCDGTYGLTISDVNGCDTVMSYTLTSPTDIVVATTTTNSNCLVCDGTATASPSGGTPGYTYNWLDASLNPIGQTGITANNLCAGVFNVVTRDRFGCLDTVSAIVANDNAPVIATTATDVSCFGLTDGTATVTGPCMPGISCTVEWLNNSGVPIGQTTATATNLATGVYIVEVTAITGCKAYDTVSVGTPSQIIANPGSTPVSCSATTLCDGTAFVAPTGGVGPYTYLWSTTETTDTIKNLCVGTFTVTITDASSCSVTSTINVTLGGTYTVTMVTTPEGCRNSCDGTAAVDIPAASFNPPYSYNWSPVPAGQQGNTTLTGLCNGTYNVTVTDGSGCTFTASNTVNTQNTIVPNDNFTNVSCGATNDGTATVNPTGGSGTYIYTWTPIPANGQGTNIATGLSVGPIEVLIVDQLNGCDTTVLFNISNSTPILPNETVTNPDCNGDCDGRISLAPTGGNGSAYTYVWTPVPPNGQGTPNANGLCAGTYTVVVSDNGGCDTTLNITITEPTAIVSNIAKLDATCNGACDGQASVAPIDGVAPYSFAWSNSLTTDTIKNLCAGNYSVTITDDNGCTTVDQITITENTPILATTSFTPSTCDVCTGTATVNPTGVGPFTFEWFDNLGVPLGVTSQSILNRCASIYSVEVTDQSTNCSELFIIPISDFGGETVTMSSTTESCIGTCDGTATASFTCSSPACSVEWFDATTGLTIGQTTTTATNLCAGDYYVQVTNGVGCVTIELVTVNSPAALGLSATSVDATCSNSCDGTATAVATGGTAPYRFVWSPAPGSGQGTANASGLCVGTYSVQIFDVNGCDVSTTVTIGSPQAVTVSFTSIDPDCGLANGSITANINGGSSPYTLQWFDATNTLLLGQTNPLITGLTAGNYTLRVRDNSSCEDFFTFSLSNTNGPTITLDSTTNLSCFGANDGELFITASGGTAPYDYLWSPNGLTFEDLTNLTAGTYTVRVTDANGCISFETYTITSPQQLSASFATTDAACGACDGIAEVTMSGGTAPYIYTWSTGSDSTKAVNLCAGIYVLNVSDANGCSETFNININNAGGPTNEIVSVTDATCRNTCDGTATITPIGGTAPYTFFWPHNSSTASTLNNLCAGSYFVQIMDVNGCMRVANVVVDEPDELIINSTVVPATCNSFPCDGSILLNVTGGTAPYSYNWGPITLPNSNFVDGLCAGSYSVDISDASGCAQTFTFVVSNTTIPINPAPTATDVSCFGSCDGTLAANFTSPLADYQWFDANNSAVAAPNTDASGLCPGIYTLELTSIPDGCKYYETIEIKEPTPLLLTQPVVQNMNCATDCDGQITVNAIGGKLPYRFAWNDANNQTSNTANNLCVGTYNVIVTDANGCSATTSASITAPTPITMTVVSTTDVTCSSNCEGTAEITVAGGISPYSISWSGGQTSSIVTGLCFGPNLVTITDANSCEFIDTVFIAAQDTVLALVGNDTIICDRGTVLLKGATQGSGVTNADWYTYPAFDLFTTSLDTTFERNSIGQYQFALIATNGISCNDTTIKTINVVPNPLIDAGRNVRIFKEEIAQISILGENSTFKYLWVPSTNLNDSTIANPTSDTRETITYTLYVTDTNGCIASDSMKVIYQEPITFPTGFTPNGDGTNDVWNLYFLADYPNATVNIFNRWGESVFESNGYTKPWDGRYKGDELPSGTYYYIIDVKDANIEPMTGPITIIR